MSPSKRNLKGYTKAAAALRQHADTAKAAISLGFFKETANDVFLGVRTPQIRKLAREFYALPLADLRQLMHSSIHEERSLAHEILRRRFEKGDDRQQKTIFDFYIRN